MVVNVCASYLVGIAVAVAAAVEAAEAGLGSGYRHIGRCCSRNHIVDLDHMCSGLCWRMYRIPIPAATTIAVTGVIGTTSLGMGFTINYEPLLS